MERSMSRRSIAILSALVAFASVAVASSVARSGAETRGDQVILTKADFVRIFDESRAVLPQSLAADREKLRLEGLKRLLWMASDASAG
jgi:hypothetical protein